MENKTSAFLEIPALRVQQPLGDFYVITMSAEQLLSISFSEPLVYQDEFGRLKGSQRPKDEKRLKEIARYIDSVEMAFPNSIILAANYTQTGAISKDESERWYIIEDSGCGISRIVIPKQIKMAAVIDGQHRLNAFEFVKNKERFESLQLVCSVYFDLPNSYQAFIFATINSNQKKVDRSLALEQFGFNVDDEPEKAWTPEKFAVFISRKLNIDKDRSPLYKHIKVAPLHVENLFADGPQNDWIVSTATIVDGITSLISNNPKRDRVEMQQKHFLSGRSREMLSKFDSDVSPLRQYFIDLKDQVIYDTIIQYFQAVASSLWRNQTSKSYITRTVGIQATFDVLKLILKQTLSVAPNQLDFSSYMQKAGNIDFSDKFFQASGIGRSRIKNTIALALGLVMKDKIKKQDLPFYEEILQGGGTENEKERWPWEEEAEGAIINVLEKANWNYGANNVGLYLNHDYENPVLFETYDKFFAQLITIAESEFISNLPGDKEFADEQREKFDAEGLVESHLFDYESNLKKMGWW